MRLWEGSELSGESGVWSVEVVFFGEMNYIVDSYRELRTALSLLAS